MFKKIIIISIVLTIMLLPTILFAQADFHDDLNSYNTSLWTKAHGWTNGSPFNCFWQADQITFSGGQLAITIDQYFGSPPWKSGEYRSNQNYQYGFLQLLQYNI